MRHCRADFASSLRSLAFILSVKTVGFAGKAVERRETEIARQIKGEVLSMDSSNDKEILLLLLCIVRRRRRTKARR